jgi:hypothetical protein
MNINKKWKEKIMTIQAIIIIVLLGISAGLTIAWIIDVGNL